MVADGVASRRTGSGGGGSVLVVARRAEHRLHRGHLLRWHTAMTTAMEAAPPITETSFS
jgi:mevalonate kinase